MKLFSEKVNPTLTNSTLNIIQVEDYEEIFFGVYEIEINKTKYPVEKISEHNGDPVVSVPVLVEGNEKVYYPFVLSKGKQEVLFNENNTLETLETLEVINEDVEIDIDDEIEIVDNSARILKQIQEAKQEAKRQTNIYNRNKLKEFSEKTEKYEERLTGTLETARETLVDEFLNISKSIKTELIDSNDLRFTEISKTIDNKIGDLALSLSESLAKDSKTSSKQFDSNIRKLIVGMYKSKLTPMIEGEMKTIAEDIVERVDNIGTDLDLKLESKVDKTIVEGVNNEMDAIRESNIDLNDKINRGVNKALSRVGNVTTKVDELTIALAEEIDDKIAKVEGNITDYYTKKLTMLEEKNFNVTEETRKYIVQLVSESRDNLVNEIHDLKNEKPIEYLIESNGKPENIDFRGFKKDMNKDIDKRISDKISNEVLSLRRYIVTMGGGGGTVAMQFADGGTMQGSLNIVGDLLVVGSISASEYLGLPAGADGADGADGLENISAATTTAFDGILAGDGVNAQVATTAQKLALPINTAAQTALDLKAPLASPAITGDATVAGTFDVNHTATEADDHALEIDCDAAGFGDVKAIDIVYDTGAITTGQDEAVILVNIDELAATGGEVTALEVLATEGSANINGMLLGIGVNPIEQLSGVFTDMDSALVNATDRLTELTTAGSDVQMFAADNDTVTIGSSAKFEEIEFRLAITANLSIRPDFDFSTGSGTWQTFTPVDGTNGMRNTGVIAWLDGDIPTWAVGTGGEYLIRITRKRNNLDTPPTESKVQIAEATEYKWDKDGDLSVHSITATGAVAGSNLSGNNTGDVAQLGQIVATVGGVGTAVTTGFKGFIRVPYNCSITAAIVDADQTGSIVWDVWLDTVSTNPITDVTVADTITASAKPTLSSATYTADATLTGWTTAATVGQYLGFNIDSAATLTRSTLTLTITRT